MAASSSSSSGEQQYSLRWNDFHSSILSSFRHLRDEEDFVDVTLACDSSSFTAHKVVLSACSPYFRRLLKANPCQHPIVILRDVASSDMESLLRFMYHGEVHVGQEQLTAFLKTAQMLQVRGLADVNSGANKIPQQTSSANNGSNPTTPRLPWHDSGGGGGGRGGTGGDGLALNDSGLSPPPEKRPRSYSPPLIGNHVEQKSELQESLLGQALEGGPTIHTTPGNNLQKGNHDNSLQAQSTGEDSNSLSENEEDISNNESMLNSVKTEPADMINDSMEHHRSTFPAALLGLQGLMPGPSGIHAANQDPSYGRWQPSGGDGSAPSTGWVPGASSSSSSSRNEQPGTTGSVLTGESVILVPGTTNSYHGQQQQQILSQKQDITTTTTTTSGILHQGNGNLAQQQQQQQVLQCSSSINTDQLIIMQQKLQENIQNSLNHHHHHHHHHHNSHNIHQTQSSAIKNDTLQNMMLQQQSSSSSISTSSGSCLIKKKFIDTANIAINIGNYSHNHNLDSNVVVGGGLINSHTNNNGKPKCPECGKIYSNNSNLKQHIVNVHTVQTEYISCHVCSKQFKTKQYLQIHLLSMHGIRKRKSYPVYQLQNNNQTTHDHSDSNQQIILSTSHINQQQYHNDGQSNASRWNDDKN